MSTIPSAISWYSAVEGIALKSPQIMIGGVVAAVVVAVGDFDVDAAAANLSISLNIILPVAVLVSGLLGRNAI